MMPAGHDRRIAVLQAFEAAINRGESEAALALFAPDSSITEEGVRYASVRDALAYLVGTETRLSLGDFAATANGAACSYHEVNALDRAIGYGGSTRRAEATFTDSDQIAALVILPRPLEERQRALRRIEPFFDWLRAEHPAEWSSMSALSLESGATLARMARLWAATRPSE
jgi:hypothetical protein